ncbi:FmdB family zinc ribbon protein [Kineococcus glutinatus]|uniref:Putative regulatory protein FmdB zinc ribbon domain-containing protein n=1 Tax=Kineococcus glutinatus TaxID=1070872 RepID=A0ABP9I9V6_9ACTN
MPTYAYACSQCQHRFEVHQSFTDDALTDCPECGGRLRKQFGSVGVVFKGSGFYRTDSRGSSTASEKSGAGSSSSSSASGSAAGSTTPSPAAGSSSGSTKSSSSGSAAGSTPAA